MHENAPPAVPPVKIPVGAFLILFLPLSLAASIWAAGSIREAARRERGTRQTAGEIISSRVEALPCYGTCKGGRSYRPRVSYRYTIDGRPYTSERVTPLGDAGRFAWAANVVSKYPPRQSAVVHYNPAEPGFAYLEASPMWSRWLLATVPLALTCCFAGAMWERNGRVGRVLSSRP